MEATASDAKILLDRLFLRYVTSPSNVDGGTIVIGSSVTNGSADGAVVADDATSLTKEERFLKNLAPRGWLNHDNVLAFLYALDELSGSKSVDLGLSDTVFKNRNPAAYANRNTVFILLNWKNNHWTLGVVSRSPGATESTFRHHDSLPNDAGRATEAFDIVKRKFGAENDMVFDEVTSSAEQEDGSSCGLYVCLYATLETFWAGQTLAGPIDPKDLTTFREKMRDAKGVCTVIETVRFTPEAARDLIKFAKEVVGKNLSAAASPENPTAFGFQELSRTRTGEDFTLSDRKNWYFPHLIEDRDRIFIVYKFDDGYVRVLVNVETLPAEKRKIVEKIAGGASHVIVDEDLLHALHGWERRTADEPAASSSISFDLDAVVDALGVDNSHSVDFGDPLLDNDPNDISSVRTSDFGEDDPDVRALNRLRGRNSEPIDPNMFNSGPVPERKKVWSSIHDIASGADALFGLGPFAGRENPPPRPRVVDDADPVLLEAQMWLNA